jgi:hypothetical protein
MPPSDLAPKARLQGVAVFLSASVPVPERAKEYRRIPEAPLRIEEAVVSIARAIFIEGGTLVFGGHPSISPLVARVADHYYLPAPAEELEHKDLRESQLEWRNPSVVIYQSRAWEPLWAEATKRLTGHPLVRVQWVEGEPGEKVDSKIKDRPQALASLRRMREAMIKETSPEAMIAVGGMRGVLDEAALFAELRPGVPIFVLATTGGAAALLAEDSSLSKVVRTVDAEAGALVREFWKHQESEQAERLSKSESFAEEESREFYIPYAFVAQQIADVIAERLDRT